VWHFIIVPSAAVAEVVMLSVAIMLGILCTECRYAECGNYA
jgi:hypothetical protein